METITVWAGARYLGPDRLGQGHHRGGHLGPWPPLTPGMVRKRRAVRSRCRRLGTSPMGTSAGSSLIFMKGRTACPSSSVGRARLPPERSVPAWWDLVDLMATFAAAAKARMMDGKGRIPQLPSALGNSHGGRPTPDFGDDVRQRVRHPERASQADPESGSGCNGEWGNEPADEVAWKAAVTAFGHPPHLSELGFLSSFSSTTSPVIPGNQKFGGGISPMTSIPSSNRSTPWSLPGGRRPATGCRTSASCIISRRSRISC